MIVTFGIVSAFKLTHVVAAGDVVIASVISKLWIIATFPRLVEFPSENHSPNTPVLARWPYGFSRTTIGVRRRDRVG